MSCIIRKTTSNIYKSIEKDDTVVLKWNQDSDEEQEEPNNGENDIQVLGLPVQNDNSQQINVNNNYFDNSVNSLPLP